MRVVLTTRGSYGDLNPYIDLALGLWIGGHEPIFATIPRYRADVEREGGVAAVIAARRYRVDRAAVGKAVEAEGGISSACRAIEQEIAP